MRKTSRTILGVIVVCMLGCQTEPVKEDYRLEIVEAPDHINLDVVSNETTIATIRVDSAGNLLHITKPISDSLKAYASFYRGTGRLHTLGYYDNIGRRQDNWIQFYDTSSSLLTTRVYFDDRISGYVTKYKDWFGPVTDTFVYDTEGVARLRRVINK